MNGMLDKVFMHNGDEHEKLRMGETVPVFLNGVDSFGNDVTRMCGRGD